MLLDNVRLLENGRAGLAVGGSSRVTAANCELAGNLAFQLINSERARTDLVDTTITADPGGELSVRGGQVLIDGEPAEAP